MRSTARRRLFAVVTVTLAFALTAGAAPAQEPDRPWMNTALSPDARAALLLQAMTLEEKVELMTGDQGEAPSAFYNSPIARLGIPELSMADAGIGIASRGWELPETADRATAMPSSIALAATFDQEVARAFAGVVADEAVQTGHEMLLGPNADPVRQPFWGRIAESGGEDPELASAIAVPFVEEVQERNVIADLKHYVGYAQETNRGTGQNTIVSERALREVHTLPYEDAIREADLGSVMCSFNKLNGVYVCESDYALDTILRRQLGFTGFVITDFGAIHSTEPSVQAGTDMETGTRAFYDGPLLAAVNDGRVPESLVDRSVSRILRTMFAIGVFDNDYTPSAIPVEEHGQVAEEAQTEAITLLKNDDDALPLDDDIDSIAVIGADATITAAAGGASRVTPTYERSLVEGVRTRAAEDGITIRYREGNDPVNAANMIEAPDMTAVPSSALTPERGVGNGLTASYFGNATLSGPPALTRTETQVLYDTGFTGGQPAFANLYSSQRPPTAVVVQGLGSGQSVRYSGYLTAPDSGSHQLGLAGWGDARVWLDDELIVDMTGENGLRDARSAPLDLRRGERHRLRIEYAATRPFTPSLDPGTLLLQWSTPADARPPASVRRAARAAARSDAAVVYVRTYESEQRDRLSLKLPQNAEQLVREISAANPRTVVVAASGGPVTMPWADRVPAIVENYFGGQEEGDALARVLFGDDDPAGHLPLTFPRSEEELPPGVENPYAGIDNLDVPFAEDVNIGYRGYIAAGVDPLFPFGHGLSYTEFDYSRLRVNGLRATGGDDTARVRLRVTNSGDRSGTELVQVYVGALPGVASPPRKLAGWEKVELEPGERARVRIRIDRRAFSYWDGDSDRWVTPTGTVPVYVGSSASDVRLSGTVRVR
ncbi:MAG TPA: glycoside hydrolase family 3 C-terminal domain-containing protein [Thermoleophilaceae bacterium]|nr:glycoside hydrolase family 3 C-terminal domain-containing protein [Thermoleophilaceae bacterium]